MDCRNKWKHYENTRKSTSDQGWRCGRQVKKILGAKGWDLSPPWCVSPLWDIRASLGGSRASARR